MATTANIVSVWTSEDGSKVFMAASVNEGGSKGCAEYIGSVDNDDAFKALTTAQKKTALIAAVKAVREPLVAKRTTVAGITGSVAV